MQLPTDLKDYRAPDEGLGAFQLIEEFAAGWALLTMAILGCIFAPVMR